MQSIEKYLTIHGHFYQPPRENPWIEDIEIQESAHPFHDWNERICCECYNPNSCSKVVNSANKVMQIVNNYSKMSFNFGPTLLSWMEKYAPLSYERIIKADVESRGEHSGHGNAMAQVYNHMIMPLANYRDKVTQTLWGIRDFEYRFGRKPEGIWLAETAIDDETIEVLVDNGIKFTVLSPFQALKFRELNSTQWQDVSWGNIDPARPYRYFCKKNPDKYIDLFFYDGAISKSVAFDELLKDGQKFSNRLQDGISSSRNYKTQLVNIATDGESYGHHTQFGDMALSYLLRYKAEQDGFKITNYGEFLEKFPPKCEVDIKQASSWSCFHGVGRWKEDCGCSTGGHGGWNQKWRKPLREALDFLRDKMIVLFEQEGVKYFNKDVWDVRNAYIDVVLDRSELNVQAFIREHFVNNLSEVEISKAIKLLEIQRQAMLMYTSCGWFFSEISGIETVQIMKYAARAMQLAADFTNEDFETPFVEILDLAQSNIPEFKTGKNVYERFVKPATISMKQIASLWAITSLYTKYEEKSKLYCYNILTKNYKKVQKGNGALIIGEIEIQSEITLERSNMIFALLQYQGLDFHCAIKETNDTSLFAKIKPQLLQTYTMQPLTEMIRELDNLFGKEYFTLKDIFSDERKKVIKTMLRGKMDKFAQTYRDLYIQSRDTIQHLKALEIQLPYEIKVAAQYTLTEDFNSWILATADNISASIVQNASDILAEAKKIGVEINKIKVENLFAQILTKMIFNLTKNPEIGRTQKINEMFEYTKKLELKVDLQEAQNIFFDYIFEEFAEILEDKNKDNFSDEFIYELLKLAQNLNLDTDFYKDLCVKRKLQI